MEPTDYIYGLRPVIEAINAEILDDLLTKWEDMGYTFASLDQLPAAQ